MRMAHLYPEQKVQRVWPTHHEIHLREEEARDLTTELQEIGFNFTFAASGMERRFPLLAKIHRLLGSRNSEESPVDPTVPAKVTYSYPSGRSTTLKEVQGANAEIARGEKVRWVSR